MPREKKTRGRRAHDKKRKLEAAEDGSNKRPRSSDHEVVEAGSADDEPEQQQEEVTEEDDAEDTMSRPQAPPLETPFYGLLDEEEQEIFRRADEALELNAFSGPEEREQLVTEVWKEAQGKELKLANSQSCSRLMERLIQLSTSAQLRHLFTQFSGHFLHLVQHRFASHCCEALFLQAAPSVSEEIKSPPQPDPTDPIEAPLTMEDLYLNTVQELEGHLGFLLLDKFASHTLRVLLAVLSGTPITRSDKASVLHSKKKEHIHVHASKIEQTLDKRAVPESFKNALGTFVARSVSGFDTAFLQSLALHPTGNPTLQLLLQLELTHLGKAKAKDETSILRRLLPDDPITEDCESAKFINGSIYDPLASRLLEPIINHAPGKIFKQIYQHLIKERIASLARNDIASYTVVKVLERLGKDELQSALDSLLPEIPKLVDRNRTVVIRSLIERSQVRSLDPAPLATALRDAYSGPNGFDITKLLKLSNPPTPSSSDSTTIPPPPHDSPGKQAQAAEKLHGSLLAQAMLSTPGDLSTLILDSLARLGPELSTRIAKDPAASRTLQSALTSKLSPVITRRKMIQRFYGRVAELALDPCGSRVIDAVWTGTVGLAFVRERVAEELAENENALRESVVGRAVWRNWKMDGYRRRRREWILESRASAGNEAFLPFPGETGGDHAGADGDGREAAKYGNGRQLSAIERARLKHAEQKARRERERVKARNTEGKQAGADGVTAGREKPRAQKEKNRTKAVEV